MKNAFGKVQNMLGIGSLIREIYVKIEIWETSILLFFFLVKSMPTFCVNTVGLVDEAHIYWMIDKFIIPSYVLLQYNIFVVYYLDKQRITNNLSLFVHINLTHASQFQGNSGSQ